VVPAVARRLERESGPAAAISESEQAS
jgi:hypothetical protein